MQKHIPRATVPVRAPLRKTRESPPFQQLESWSDVMGFSIQLWHNHACKEVLGSRVKESWSLLGRRIESSGTVVKWFSPRTGARRPVLHLTHAVKPWYSSDFMQTWWYVWQGSCHGLFAKQLKLLQPTNWRVNVPESMSLIAAVLFVTLAHLPSASLWTNP